MNNYYDAQVMISLVDSDSKMPTLGSHEAAGYDLYSREDAELVSFVPTIVKTGVKLEMPDHIFARVCSRSGLATKGVFVVNAPGIVDSDFRGEVCAILMYVGTESFKIEKGQRIAQLVFDYRTIVDLKQVQSINENTQRGTSGFGSTGR